MRPRVSVVLVAAALLAALAPGVAAAKVRPTKLTVDSVVDVGDGRIVVSGRMFTRGFSCNNRAVRLQGERPNGKTVLLDWGLTSLPGDAFGLTANTAGLETIRVRVRKLKHKQPRFTCAGASKIVFPLAA
jgi:hypothetical protein